MNKRIVEIVCTILGLAIVLAGCSSKHEVIRNDKISYKNNIFTEELLKQIKEIDFGFENEMVKIQDAEKMRQFYGELASLTLTEVDEDIQPLYGHLMIEFITNDSKISVGILAKELNVEQKRYEVDKDIIKKLRKIAD
ncbi:hypothetical protein [[Clostridium] polysaccharolyticum]|uniref:Uncharacterized protein n=1 Tax=[Clostridium] polysaccharolyticum TaxID=29364 RepID=A0A1H9Y6G9_9FIRM|nr:hypothetical protein [[Clostridium] polysaccharolyticum]SES64348.1 hypothetical protein SAMN04487772_101164 [[Clostridium] polysaccharolyticum]